MQFDRVLFTTTRTTRTSCRVPGMDFAANDMNKSINDVWSTVTTRVDPAACMQAPCIGQTGLQVTYISTDDITTVQTNLAEY